MVPVLAITHSFKMSMYLQYVCHAQHKVAVYIDLPVLSYSISALFPSWSVSWTKTSYDQILLVLYMRVSKQWLNTCKTLVFHTAPFVSCKSDQLLLLFKIVYICFGPWSLMEAKLPFLCSTLFKYRTVILDTYPNFINPNLFWNQVIHNGLRVMEIFHK